LAVREEHDAELAKDDVERTRFDPRTIVVANR
jgi:hypothetical protein